MHDLFSVSFFVEQKALYLKYAVLPHSHSSPQRKLNSVKAVIEARGREVRGEVGVAETSGIAFVSFVRSRSESLWTRVRNLRGIACGISFGVFVKSRSESLWNRVWNFVRSRCGTLLALWRGGFG